MLTDRQKIILSYVADGAIETDRPVSSEYLTTKYRLPYSPATIRIEMHELEQRGYLCQPHTSAGRLPSDTGWRYFVDHLMRRKSLSREVKQRFRRILKRWQTKSKPEIGATTHVLAQVLEGLAFGVVISQKKVYWAGLSDLFRQPEFASKEAILSVAEFIDGVDEAVEEILKIGLGQDEPRLFIGEESDVTKKLDSSLMVTSLRFHQEPEVLAILAPKRMNYSLAFSIFEDLDELCC